MEIFIWIVYSILCTVGIFCALHYSGPSSKLNFDFNDIGETAAKIFASIILGFALGMILMVAWPLLIILFVIGISIGIAFGLRLVFNRNR